MFTFSYVAQKEKYMFGKNTQNIKCSKNVTFNSHMNDI